MEIKIVENVLKANQILAEEIRGRLRDAGVLTLDIMGSPGAGKTSLTERTVEALLPRLRMGVIEGDIATTLDAERLGKFGIPVVQINTGGACHLDASMILKALDSFDLASLDLLLIENVGNLVCPAEYDLGQNFKVLVSSVPEGDDKPRKYPTIFREVSAIILNKTDLIEATDFDMQRFREGLRQVGAQTPLFCVSCRTQDGLSEWIQWMSPR